MSEGMEQLLDEMINKINQITENLDGTIAQVEKMNEAINHMSKNFSKETVSLTENVRLIVEALKQFRIQSNKSVNELSKELNIKVKELLDEDQIQKYLEDTKKEIKTIKKAEKVVSDNLYYAQLLTIVKNLSTYLKQLKK
jgi:predicted ribosome quality control (RQC) complex YloA/Tae2 family protein